MAFYVGQKVVCVDDEVREADGKKRLINGQVYTIRAIASDFSHPSWTRIAKYGSGDVVWLREIANRLTSDAPYNARRFRPVVEREYDIGIFKAMLNPSDERVSA